MKKVNCTVIYSVIYNDHGNYFKEYFILHTVSVKHKNENILLYSDTWDETDRKHRYKYESFNELYKHLLDWLKHNNMYVHSWNEFNTKWYDIDFIDTANNMINRYSYKKEKKQ